ncbi:hypothetical protein [Massilia sp. TWP1-3-3]|uniref:hypothetical protein n=1 Tax=Massilia sp. TWP1-3-3 TaxID=2804573 RepID=UPI003CF36D91
MPTLANSYGPKPKGWDEFEEIVCSAAKIRFGSSDFTRHGRQGQSQDGVDVFGDDQNGKLVGIQCKNTITGVTEKTMLEEVKKAEAFKPTLSKLYVATTAEADTKLQQIVREWSEARKAAGLFPVLILFWGDIWGDLTKDKTYLAQHYPEWKVAPPRQSVGPTHDQRLFARFMAALPFEPVIRLLKEHDFNGSFFREAFNPLVAFADSWDKPENEFSDPELQTLMKVFFGEACAIASEIALRT